MRRVNSILAICTMALALTVSVSAHAQSLREAREREAEEAALNTEIAYTQTVCSSSISASIDRSSLSNWPADKSLVASCDGALGAIEAICRRDGAAKVQSIKRFVCAGDSAGPSLRGGVLRYGAAPGKNSFNETDAFLTKTLK